MKGDDRGTRCGNHPDEQQYLSETGALNQVSMGHSHCCDYDEFLKAMADGTRQHILALLRAGEMNVSEISQHFPVTQPKISYHLALLRRANLVIPRQTGQQTFYRANPDCIAECCREIMIRFMDDSVE